jgi:hypothetical protein
VAKEDNLIPFKPGESGNPLGRPRKYISTLKAQGYTKSEATDCIQVLISMDEAQLKEVAETDGHTILEQIVAAALLESKRKKTLYNIETLLTRLYGQPKQEIEQQVNITAFNVKFNEEKKIDDGNNI